MSFLVQLFWELFLVYSLANTLVFCYSHPVSVGVGSEIGQICGVFSSKDSKMHIFFWPFLNGYIHPNNFKNKKQALGALPQTPLTCEAAGAGGKPYPPTPYGECWVDSKASRVKCTTSSPFWPLSISVGVAKLTEADGAGNLSRLAKQPRSGLAFTGWGDPTLCGKGAGGFSLHPCHVANAVWAAPTVLARPLGVAQQGKMCRRHSF